MRALSLGKDKKLSIVDLPEPMAKRGEVVVKIMAAALNHREIWISKGLYPGMKLPATLGADGAGVISEIGEDVSEHWIDKEVIINPTLGWGSSERCPTKEFRLYGMPEQGTIASSIAVPIENIVEKPKHLTWEEAAALPVAGITAWRALTRHGDLQSGDNILITGIGGGVAQAGLKFAKQLGANIYVSSSSDEKIAFARSQGAIAGFNYKKEGWNLDLKKASGGIDIVLDGSLAAKFDDYMRFLNLGARVVVYGSTGSPHSTMHVSRFFLRHVSIIGTAMGSPREFETMMKFIDQHKIKPSISKSFHFNESILAFEELSTSKQIGKITITGMNPKL